MELLSMDRKKFRREKSSKASSWVSSYSFMLLLLKRIYLLKVRRERVRERGKSDRLTVTDPYNQQLAVSTHVLDSADRFSSS